MADQAATRRPKKASRQRASSARYDAPGQRQPSLEDGAPLFNFGDRSDGDPTAKVSADDPDLLQSLIIGLLEQAINRALRQDVAALEALRAYAGRIFRIKTYQPYWVVYCQFCDEGVSLLSHYDSEVDARVQAPAGKLLMLLLQQDSELSQEDFEIRILGDRLMVEQVLAILKTYDIWRWVRQFWLEWFPGVADFPQMMSKLQLEAPQWWTALQSVPATTQDLLVELKHLTETQTQMLVEIKALRLAQEQAARGMTAWQWLGVTLMMIGLLWLGLHLVP